MDLIDRQAAIEATWRDTGYTDAINAMTVMRERLEQLPSAQPTVERQEYKEVLDTIARIISISPLVIQEDVFRYKMICDVMRKYDGGEA